MRHRLCDTSPLRQQGPRWRVGLVSICLAVWACGGTAFAAEPEWKVGLAQVKITPEQPLPLSGYGGRTKPFEKVAGDLYVKAIVLEDNAGQRAALVTSDLLGFPAAVAEPICEVIQKKTGLKREHILLNSSHTHAGPQLALKVAAKDQTGEALRVVEYTRQLQDKVAEAVIQAAGRLQPAQLSWSSGVVHFVMNRREFTPSGVILGVNPRGLADRGVPVLRIDGADGKPRAVLFGAAVHGTTLGPDNYQLCGDYAGFAQAYVEERYPKAQILFMLGCAGDANPYPRGTMDLARRHGQTLGEEVCRVLDGKFRPVRGPLQIAFDRANLPLAALSTEEVRKLAANKRGAQAFAAGQMLAMLERGDKPPAHYTCPFTVWQFGQDLTLAGLPGEVVVDYVTFLEKELGPNQLWVAGYCNDVFGYLPSARVLKEGGYETRGLYAGGAGIFDPTAEAIVVQKVRDLAKKAGRKVPSQ
jgi:neutral ceramidase